MTREWWVVTPAMHIWTNASQGKYRILDEGELKERQQDAVRSVTSVLSVSDADASRVLRLFKWYAAEDTR